jgi:hypothetical protein
MAAKRRVTPVLSIIRGETSVAEAALKSGPDRRRNRGLAAAVRRRDLPPVVGAARKVLVLPIHLATSFEQRA